MPQLIKDGALAEDPYALLREAASLTDVPPEAPAIVPLALWQKERSALLARGNVGVLLAPTDDPAALAADAAAVRVVAVDFPKFGDGRGFSTARLLRERYRFRGELRAVGDVLRDQLFALRECGFDAFLIRADRNATEALAGLDDFTNVYAPTVREPQPWFRRRAATSDDEPGATRVEAAVALLRDVAARHSPAVFASSFGAEDMVVIDLIARHGCRFASSRSTPGVCPRRRYALIDRSARASTDCRSTSTRPTQRLLQSFVREHGVNAFYRSVELRKALLRVRKAEPLARALSRKGAWITGLRRTQSVTRGRPGDRGVRRGARPAEIQSAGRLEPRRGLGLPPRERRSLQRAPRSRLSEIGCAPCTRAIAPARTSAPAAGGGKRRSTRNAVCTSRRIPNVAAKAGPSAAVAS